MPKLALPAARLPVISKLVNVPTLVILGWLFTVILPAKFAKLAVTALVTLPVTLLPWILLNKLPDPLKKLAVTKLPKLALPAFKLPVISKLTNVPTDVMFGWELAVTVPAVTELPAATFVRNPPSPKKKLALAALPKLAFNDIRLPLIFAVDATKLPLNVLADTTFAPVILPVVDILPKDPLPYTSKLVNVPTLVILGWLFTVTLPA